MKPIKAIGLLRLFLNLLFTGFILIAALSNNVKNLPVGFILLYNILLLSSAWVNNFWLLPRLRRNKNVLRYVVALTLTVIAATIILGSYLQWLYLEFKTSELIDFTSLAAPSSAPSGLEKYQYYFDVIPGIIIMTAMLSVGYAIQQSLLKIKNDKQIQAQQAIAELNLLKSQISPHFLFNVLNSLYALSLKKSEETPDVILKLSDILRYSLYETQEKEISIRNEIHILNTYIDIERIRISANAQISFVCAQVRDSVKIAPMLLLPLIENAFKHGIDSTIGISYINASLICDENNLIFTCENSFKDAAKKALGGIGIDNVRKRLQLLYPSKHIFEINKGKNVFKITLEIKF